MIILNPKMDDPTWDIASLGTFSGVELVVCYMGACFPTIRPFLAIFFPKKFGDTSKRSHKPSTFQDTPTPQNASSHARSQQGSARRPSLQPFELAVMRPGRRNSSWDRISSPPTTPPGHDKEALHSSVTVFGDVQR